ncbi:MAG: glutamine-hydrolyzing carbamoyl-phosphate synthase small subunit [Candidatus Gastranaerophilales bacterium]|nr:glutamine-hydrolyzing carbamoyl-phosphate synthase small subunit [Candidatus Gastranaerophilales bacterium]
MGTLILQDGTVIKASSFGAFGGCEGEVVFNTSSSGYQEIYTDPTYAKQIVVMTYPEIGNCGINDFDNESETCHVVGVIVKNYSKQDSHYKAKESLSNYFKRKGVIALEDVDTRSLVKKLREEGTMSGYITSNDVDKDFINEKIRDLQKFKMPDDIVIDVTCKGRYVVNPQGKINLALIDYGVKKSILTALAKRDYRITVYPAVVEAREILDNKFDAVFLPNGPGNPESYVSQISQIKQLMGKLPIFGVCLGCQLLALAAGAKTYKLKYGHRGSNHPIINLENSKIFMANQNHGYAVDMESMPKIIRPTFKNLNDDTLEGFEISSLRIYALQFNPEAGDGRCDTSNILDEWANIAKKDINKMQEVEDER